MRHHILISTGSNIEKEKYTQAGLDDLAAMFGPLVVSRVFESQAVGFDGDTFYNAVVSAHTQLALEEVCAGLKEIELRNGRVKQAEKFSSRTLDLDLLSFDNMICQHPLVLPREEILFNAFVLQPLAEIMPNKIHPVVKQTYSQLWNDFDKSKQSLWVSDFKWSQKQS